MAGSRGARVRTVPRLPAIAAGLALVLAACGASASPAPSGSARPSASVSSTRGATMPPSAVPATPLPSGSSDPDRLARFHAHAIASVATLTALLGTMERDAGLSPTALPKDAADLKAWSTAETAWLTANPAAACYAILGTQLDTARAHALQAATKAAAGTYDQYEVADSRSAATRLLEMLQRTDLCK